LIDIAIGVTVGDPRYFKEMLRRVGWTYDFEKSDSNGLVFSIVSKRC
jgi:hypothetical protein